MKKRIALVIMAAGIGSRFGEGIKQLEPVGLHDEIIIDYSIHDAMEAGFNKIVFIIREDIKEAFHERIGERIERICAQKDVEVAYAFQKKDDLPAGYEVRIIGAFFFSAVPSSREEARIRLLSV